jgi:hypothetical protein
MVGLVEEEGMVPLTRRSLLRATPALLLPRPALAGIWRGHGGEFDKIHRCVIVVVKDDVPHARTLCLYLILFEEIESRFIDVKCNAGQASGRGAAWPVDDQRGKRANRHRRAASDNVINLQLLAAANSCERLQSACAVKRRRFPVGARPTRRFAPAGSNRSSHGGNEMAEAFE